MPSMAHARSRPYLSTTVIFSPPPAWPSVSSRRTSEMNPSFLRISAMCSLRLDAGIVVLSRCTSDALRMRVNMSAMGSVIMASPARLQQARHLAPQAEDPQADAAQLEVAVIAARAPADFAAVAVAGRELGNPV